MSSSVFSSTYDPVWDDNSQIYRTPFNITITGGSDITNLTTQIIINESVMGENFNFSEHRDSFRMKYFNESSSTWLDVSHYSPDWDNVSKSATIQFRAIFLSGSGDSRYWIYYGNSTLTNSEDECDTFIYCDYFDDASMNSRLSTTDEDTVSGTYFQEGDGKLKIGAGGADTWTSSDQYGSIYLENVAGDLEIMVEASNETNANSWTKAGIMVRNDMTASGSSTGYVFNIRRPTSGFSFQRDSNNNGFLDASSTGGSTGTTTPAYLRLIKDGTSFSGYRSSSGFGSWSLLATSTVSSAQAIQDVGLSLTSHAGSTIAHSAFDNFTVRRYTTETYTYLNGSSETFLNSLNASVNSPSTFVTLSLNQNKSFTYNVTVSCIGVVDGCGNVSAYLKYNSTSGIRNVNTSIGDKPLFTNNSLPQSCSMNVGDHCTFTWNVNMSGDVASSFNLFSEFESNLTDIFNTSTILENVSVLIVQGNTVSFNISNYDFGSTTKNLGDLTTSIRITSDNGNNNNIKLECESGNCSVFSDNWNDNNDLLEGNSADFTLTCSDDDIGSYSAIFNLTSDEFDNSRKLNVSCFVDKLYGPFSGDLLSPIANAITNVIQNNSINISSNATCLGECGNVSASLVYVYDDWWNSSFNYRQEINISSSTTSQAYYQVYVNLNSSVLGNSFDWSNNCNDIRFVHNNSELSYWIQNCSTSSEVIEVWVESDDNITSSAYEVDLYYGNSNAVSKSSASETFYADYISIITGNCPSGNGACNHLDNHADADTIRSSIGTGSFTVHGEGFTQDGEDTSNPFGSDQNFFLRYRFLFIADVTGTHSFGTASDDGSDFSYFPRDGYGGGIRTTHPFGAHEVVADWYGAHGSSTCGSSPGVERTKDLVSGQGYWFDYIMTEVGGGQDADMCIDEGSGYNRVSATNHPSQIFARYYTTPEPTVDSFGVEEALRVSTNSSHSPFYTFNSQPLTCLMPEGGYCEFEWELNATGLVNTSHNLRVIYVSNYSQVSSITTSNTTIRIVDKGNPPTHTQPLLVSEYATNLTGEVLYCYNQSTNDADSDPVKNIFNWFRNSTSITPINLVFEGESDGSFSRNYGDSSRNATVSGATWSNSSGYDGFGAYNFDGSNDFMSIDSSSDLDDFTEFSIEAWLRPNSTLANFGYVLSKRDSSVVSYGLNYDTTSSDIWRFFINDYTNINVDAPMDRDVWSHVVGTYDSDKMKIYVNGVLKDVLDFNLSITQTPSVDILIGARRTSGSTGSTFYFNGTIDDVKLYNFSLSEEQVIFNYNNLTNQLDSSFTQYNDSWFCEVTPNDLNFDGETLASNLLNISYDDGESGTSIFNSTKVENYSFNLGTLDSLRFEDDGNYLEINSGLNGNFTSQIFSLPYEANVSWKNISLFTHTCYGCDLPDNSSSDGVFYIDDLNMSSNEFLLHLDESSGNPLETSGTSKSFSSQGSIAYLHEGVFDTSYVFNEVNSYLETSDFGGSFNNLTLSMWFKINDTSGSDYQYLFSWGTISTSNSINVFIGEDSGSDPNTLTTNINDGTETNRGVEIANFDSYVDNRWHLYTLVKTQDGVRIYLDGEIKAVSDAGDGSINPSSSINIGRRIDGNSNRYYGGALDEISFWSKSLDEETVENLYSRGAVDLNISIRSCDDALCSGESYSVISDSNFNELRLRDFENHLQYKINFSSLDSRLSPKLYNVSIAYGLPDPTNIRDYSLSKRIESINNNLYLIHLEVNNSDSDSLNFTLFDFVPNNFVNGSFNYLPNSTFVLSGDTYNGSMNLWNMTLTPNSKLEVNYSIVGIDGDFNILNASIFGIE